jgi:hypothetical protein
VRTSVLSVPNRRLAAHLRSLAGEQNHFVLGRHPHRSDRAAVVEWHGPKPVHDPRVICNWLRATADGCQPRTSVRGSGFLNPRKRSVYNTGLQPWLLFSDYCPWKHRPPLCHLDRSVPGFPTSRCRQRPRVRFSFKKTA